MNSEEELNIVNSVLSVKASGIDLEQTIQQDILLPEGKSIAQLIYDQEKEQPQKDN